MEDAIFTAFDVVKTACQKPWEAIVTQEKARGKHYFAPIALWRCAQAQKAGNRKTEAGSERESCILHTAM